MEATVIFGVDFTSAPGPRKPITVARGMLTGNVLAIDDLARLRTFDAFESWLRTPGPWVGGFDFPFGLPRALLETLEWPHSAADGTGPWARMVRHLDAMPRPAMVAAFRDWCASRPAGRKFAHRATDGPAGSSPSMKWVNPPVAQMLQAGAPRLLAAGVTIPGMIDGDQRRIALEAYPGMLARRLIGRASYKSDAAVGRTPARAQQRIRLVAALERGEPTGIRVAFGNGLADACIADPGADLLDAVLCSVLAAWGAMRAGSGWGLVWPVDPVEGWIVGCGADWARTEGRQADGPSPNGQRSA